MGDQLELCESSRRKIFADNLQSHFVGEYGPDNAARLLGMTRADVLAYLGSEKEIDMETMRKICGMFHTTAEKLVSERIPFHAAWAQEEAVLPQTLDSAGAAQEEAGMRTEDGEEKKPEQDRTKKRRTKALHSMFIAGTDGKPFGNTLNDFAILNRYTDKDMDRMTGISANTIGRMRNGEMGRPCPAAIDLLVRGTGRPHEETGAVCTGLGTEFANLLRKKGFIDSVRAVRAVGPVQEPEEPAAEAPAGKEESVYSVTITREDYDDLKMLQKDRRKDVILAILDKFFDGKEPDPEFDDVAMYAYRLFMKHRTKAE